MKVNGFKDILFKALYLGGLTLSPMMAIAQSNALLDISSSNPMVQFGDNSVPTEQNEGGATFAEGATGNEDTLSDDQNVAKNFIAGPTFNSSEAQPFIVNIKQDELFNKVNTVNRPSLGLIEGPFNTGHASEVQKINEEFSLSRYADSSRSNAANCGGGKCTSDSLCSHLLNENFNQVKGHCASSASNLNSFSPGDVADGMNQELLRNQAALTALKGLAIESSTKGAAMLATAALSTLQERKIKKLIKKIRKDAQFPDAEQVQNPEEILGQFCQEFPQDIRCTGANSLDPSRVGFVDPNQINIAGASVNSDVGDNFNAAADTTKRDPTATQSADQDSVGPGLLPDSPSTVTSNDIIGAPRAAQAKLKNVAGGPGGGGGGGGGASAPGSSAKAPEGAGAPNSVSISGSGLGYGKGGSGYQYAGGRNNSRKGQSKNPFSGLFGKSGPGKNLKFRDVASIGKKDGNIFDRISKGYVKAVESDRLNYSLQNKAKK